VRLATNYDRIHTAGGEVIAISVDDQVRQAGMAERWGFTHTTFVADAGGETWLKPLGLFNPDDRGGIALPAMLVIDPDGNEIYRYQGRDFADRTRDDDIWDALEGLGLDPVSPQPWDSGGIDIPEDLGRFFRPSDLEAYFKGNMFGALAIKMRLDSPEAAAVAEEHQLMSKATLDAWEQWSHNSP